jgi:hypothetical protein
MSPVAASTFPNTIGVLSYYGKSAYFVLNVLRPPADARLAVYGTGSVGFAALLGGAGHRCPDHRRG